MKIKQKFIENGFIVEIENKAQFDSLLLALKRQTDLRLPDGRKLKDFNFEEEFNITSDDYRLIRLLRYVEVSDGLFDYYIEAPFVPVSRFEGIWEMDMEDIELLIKERKSHG